MERSSQIRVTGRFTAAALSAALACSGFAFVGQAHAVTAAEKAAEAESALTQLTAMQETLEQKSNEYYQTLADYQDAVEKRDAAQARIDEITEQITDIQGRLGNRAREMYRNGSSSFVDLLLGASSFDEFAQNWDLLNRVNETDADLSCKARDLRAETEEQKKVLVKQAAAAEEKSAAAGAAFQNAEELVNQMQATYDSLSAEAQELYAAEQAAAAAAAQGGVLNDDGTVTDVETGQVYADAGAYTEATGNAIVDRARAMIGHGYQYGGTGANGYFDCSGLVGYALTGSYDRIGNTTTFMGYKRVSDPQPGDICVNAGHTGIYVGNGRMIHAADESTGVVEGNVQKGMIYVRR